MTEKKKLICTRPFEWYEVGTKAFWPNSSGYPVFLCCKGWLKKEVGDLLKEDAKKIWFGNNAREIRKSVIDGTFKYCNGEFCPHLSTVTGPVKYVDDTEYKKYESKLNKDDHFYPKTLNCSYDSSCNLSCPSCRSFQMMAKGEEKERVSKVGEHLLNSFGESLESIYITGSGDPFASKHFLDLLTGEKLKKHTHLKLHLHTNAQLFTREIWERIKPTKDHIDILEVSIDGASKKTYEINRRPGKWEVLLQNMQFISELKRQGRIRHLKISFVVQKNNYKEIGAFIKLGKQWSVDEVYFATLADWDTFAKSDYLGRAIHKPTHPEHFLLLEELMKIDATDTIIDLGYFQELHKTHSNRQNNKGLFRKVASLLKSKGTSM